MVCTTCPACRMTNLRIGFIGVNLDLALVGRRTEKSEPRQEDGEAQPGQAGNHQPAPAGAGSGLP